MAEESEGYFDPKKKIVNHNQIARAPENGWIVRRSQKRPEYFYYFNTLTGESVWRDPQEPLLDAALIDKTKVPFECHEPTEPPKEAQSHNHQNAMPSSSAPKIYNKQIINNQFPAKSFPIDPFGNSACAPYGLLNNNNGMGVSVPPAHVWVAAPPQVLLGPSVATLNQVPAIFGGLENLQLQNPSLTLSNRFHVLNQIHNDILNGSSVVDGKDNHQSIKNCNNFQQRPKRNFVNKNFNRPKDLRSILSSRRRSLHSTPDDKSEKKHDLTADITVNDLKPDDTDEWMQEHTDSEGKKLTIDIDCIWDLANRSVSRDCWYIVPTARALLNNMRFITSLVITDERLRVLVPQDAVRALRSAAFSDDTRLADCASRARTFAIRQMSKIPNKVKSAANVGSCRQLIESDIHIVYLIDEKDNIHKDITSDVQITATELKRCFKSTADSVVEPVSKIQKIVEGIKIVIPNTEAKTESVSRLDQIASQPTQVATQFENERTEIKGLNVPNTESLLKETEIQTDLTVPASPAKQTANACVQTDFDFNLIPSTMKPQETMINPEADSEASSDKITTKTTSRKIKLKRQQSTNATSNSYEKKGFRWRKRKDPALPSSVDPPQVDSQHKSVSRASSPPSISNNNLLAQDNDNAMDFGHSDVSVHADIVVESSTSGVISNSIDSETMFRINKQAILSESRTERKEEIVMYEITNDSMKDRLNMRWDEWMSRFVQIMEEGLSQVLLLEPAFTDDTLLGPWTIEEAAEGIKRKFKDHNIIVDASDILIRFLLRINYDSGNIKTRISPANFMQMYSYGVNLVNKLQLVIENCEDLHIASQHLSKLLDDIQEPNSDESCEMEKFNFDDPINYSPNISESVTDLSATVADNTVPASFVSPQKERKRTSCNNSPARYSLRSSRSAEQKEEKTVGVTCNEDKAYNLFSSLGLQKTTPNVPVTPPFTQTQDLADNNVPNVQENVADRREPKIIRHCSIYPELEKKFLQNCANIEADKYEENGACGADDYVVDEYTDNRYSINQYVTDDYIDFEDDNYANIEQYRNENYVYNNDMSRTTSMDVDQTFENTELGDLNANEILKRCVMHTTHKYRRWLADLHKFCKVTNESMKTIDYSQADIVEKTRKVSEHAKNVCHRLKCILDRDPYATSKNFRDLMRDYGIHDFDMNDNQLAEYRVIIEQYLKLAQQLSTCVTRLADSAKAE